MEREKEDKRLEINGILFLTAWWFYRGRGEGEPCLTVWDRELLARLSSPIDGYLEIGVCEGHSMRWVLENLNPKSAIGIDPFIPKRGEHEHTKMCHVNMLRNLEPWLQTEQCRIIYEPSQTYLRRTDKDQDIVVPDDSFDLIFVDGSHEGLQAITDMVLCWPKLRVGGIMVMDDYDRRWYIGRPHTKEAIDAFLDAAASKYDWLWGCPRKLWNCQIGIRKLGN